MACNATLQLKGQSQGQIKNGPSTTLNVIAWCHEVIAPRDAASGLPTGKRQHHPFVITKVVDEASPRLANLLVNNECISEWVLTSWRLLSNGRKTPCFTVRLTNASICSIRSEMLNNQLPATSDLAPREHISFSYEKIEWTHLPSGTTAEDDWTAPVA